MKTFCLSLLCSLLLWIEPASPAQVRLSAAASLTDVVRELIEVYRQDHPDRDVIPNFASSGALARQIVAGAPSDLFISANPEWMDYLAKQGLVAEETRRTLVENRLVFVGQPRPQIDSLAQIVQLSRIAICTPSASPAGKYAEEALIAAGLYAQLSSERRLIPAKDVLQALLYAERGEVDGAFIYQTDARAARQAKILFSVPQELYPQILYPAALTRAGAQEQAAREFFSFLFSRTAQEVFRNHGFILPEAENHAGPFAH